LNPSTVLFDELHAQPNRRLYDVMCFGSGVARRQPLYWYITTAGDDPDRKTIGWQVHKRAEDILLGRKIDPTWYVVIYGFDPEERRIWNGYGCETYREEDGITWASESVWRATHPSLGHTFSLERLHEEYVSAKGDGANERLFRQLHVNEWVKEKAAKWLPLTVWDKSAGELDAKRLLEYLRGRECYGGLDLSSKIDLTAFDLIFPPLNDEDWYVLAWFWIPEENMKERVLRDGVPYQQWVDRGFIRTTPGNVIDYAFIRKAIVELRDQYDIREIGFDPWNATQTSLELTDDGLTCIPLRQTYETFSEPMKTAQALVKGQKLHHGGHPILRWNVGNLEVKTDPNANIRPIKTDRTERVDGAFAAFNALNRALLHVPKKPSVYETRGIITV
jgi:phage terminase large subunit-like protein